MVQRYVIFITFANFLWVSFTFFNIFAYFFWLFQYFAVTLLSKFEF
ncbi:hypothetical protein PREVCOP_05145 [Segatella copri DSM 18205]|uniref:Uncharacterized protein n=1 Tax=Segatella copri DSM 18205 TaxID=537011 RepID=D1PD59_9BACT|nr:hypothetical protein PREVCOP_05145 [Segatella copri DSM 18205]